MNPIQDFDDETATESTDDVDFGVCWSCGCDHYAARPQGCTGLHHNDIVEVES